MLITFHVIVYNILVFFSYNIYEYLFLISAILTGLLFFIIKGIIKKQGKEAVIPSIQVFLIFSIIPYIIFQTGWITRIFANILGFILFYIIIILPEIVLFLGLIWISKKKIVLGTILISIGILVAIEIVPIRMSFMLASSEVMIRRSSDPNKMKPFGKINRELEFKRSLNTIENLIVSPEKTPAESLKIVTLYIPDFEKDPDILKSAATYSSPREYWEDFGDNFDKKVLELNVKLDTDGDGLSDYEEAQLLTDAYSRDTDGDGIVDNEDSDPINPLIESDFAEINALIIEHFTIDEELSFCLIDNRFYNGRGEIANINKHVVLLSDNQDYLWHKIFDQSYWFPPPNIAIGRHLFDISRTIVVVDVTPYDVGIILLLIKSGGHWRIFAQRGIWIP